MSVQDNQNLVDRFWEEVWNQGNLAAANDMVTENFVLFTPQGQKDGPEGLKQWVNAIRSAAPDIRFTIDETIAEGNKVVSNWSGHGVNSGSFLGRAPTNKELTMSGISIFRVEDGKIAEERLAENTWEIMQQLGFVTLGK